MNKSLWIGLAIGVAVATAGGVFASYKLKDSSSAQQPQAAVPHCYEQTVTNDPPRKDEHRIAGTVLGAVIGGAVGKDVGNRDITTAVGAAAGAAVGNGIQRRVQNNRSTSTTETHCDPG